MSLSDFAQGMGQLEGHLGRVEGKLDQVAAKIDGTVGKFDALIAQCEKTGSAVDSFGGTVVEAVRLSGEAVPTLQGVAWEMYETTKKIEEAEKVSRDKLDSVAKLLDKYVAGHDLWTKHFLALAEQGKMTLADLEKTIEQWFNEPGVIQMNTVLHGDIPNFILNFRKLMKEMKDGAKESADAWGNAAKKVEEVRNVVAGMENGPASGPMSSTSSGGKPTGIVTTSGMASALNSTRGR